MILDSNHLTELFDFTPLKKLKKLSLGSLNLSEIPKSLFSLTQLTSLNLYRFLERRSDVSAAEFAPFKELKKLNYFELYLSSFIRKKEEYDKVQAFLPADCEYKGR